MRDGPDDLLGWATDSLIRLDALAPGLISRLLTVSPLRRQAIFTVLASRQLVELHDESLGRSDDGDEEKLAHVLREGRAREILEYAFKDVPEGWLGALERLGGEPMRGRNAYIKLHSIFANPSHRNKAKALRHVGQITEKMLLILDALDERWVHAEVLKRIECLAEAKDFNRAIAFAQSVCSRATNEAVADAIARLPPQASLTRLVHRYVQRADRYPDHPVARTEDLRPLTNSRDLIEAGRRFRNCLPRKVGDVLVGSVSFAEFHGECILEFRPLSGRCGWLLWEVHGPRNEPLPAHLAQAAADACLHQGIPRVDDGVGGDDWRRYRRFIRQGEWTHWAA
jgi:hypothetical protein